MPPVIIPQTPPVIICTFDYELKKKCQCYIDLVKTTSGQLVD